MKKTRIGNARLSAAFKVFLGIVLVVSLAPNFMWATDDEPSAAEQRMAESAQADSSLGLSEDLALLAQNAEDIVADEPDASGEPAENVAVPITEETLVDSAVSEDSASLASGDAQEPAPAVLDTNNEAAPAADELVAVESAESAPASASDAPAAAEEQASQEGASAAPADSTQAAEATNPASSSEGSAASRTGVADDSATNNAAADDVAAAASFSAKKGMKALADEEDEAKDEDVDGIWTIGEKKFATLQAAIEAAADGDTIKLTADAADDTAAVVDGKSLTIDLGGHTVSGKNMSKCSILSLQNSANVSISNGTMRDGNASYKWGSNTWRDNDAGAIMSQKSTLAVSNVSFIDNREGGGSYTSASAINAKETTLNVSGCAFTQSSLVDNEHAAISAEQSLVSIDSSAFDNLYKALYLTNNNNVSVSNCSFTNQMPDGTRGTYQSYIQVIGAETYKSKQSQYATFTNCVISGNKTYSDNYDTSILAFESTIDAPNSFNVVLKNCTITDNSMLASTDSHCNYILKASSRWGMSPLDISFEDTLISDNAANHATVFIGSGVTATFGNSVVKNNVAKGAKSYTRLAGGVYFAGNSLTLDSSAVYNNVLERQSDFSPAKGNDIFVDTTSGRLVAPAAADMYDFMDPSYDFSGLVWKDGGMSGFEVQPAVTSGDSRYYTITDKSALSVAQIGETVYESVEDAFAAAVAGDTIKIVADALKVSVKEPIVVDKDLTLALEDHNVLYAPAEGQAAPLFTVKDGVTFTLGNVQSERYNINANGSTDVEGGIESGAMLVEEGATLVLDDYMITNGITNNGDLVLNGFQKNIVVALGKGKFVTLGDAYKTATGKDGKIALTLDADVLAELNGGSSDDVLIAKGGNENLFVGITVAGLTNSAVFKTMEGDSIVLHTRNALYLSGAGNDAADGTTASTAVKTFAEVEKRMADDSQIDAVIVCGTVPVSDAQTWTLPKGAIMMRALGFTDYLARIADGGKLTLENIVVDGNLIDAQAALIHVQKGGALEINEGTVLKNNRNKLTGMCWGGAVYNQGGSTRMSGGAIRNNEAIHGGGVCVLGGTFDFVGGRIENNTASTSMASGGGLCVLAGAVATMGAAGGGMHAMAGDVDGPIIANNSSGGSGGGVGVGAPNSAHNLYHNTSAGQYTNMGTKFVMNGGLIDGNTAINTGGGIFVQLSCEAYVYAGAITNNKVTSSNYHFSGGGIYVNGLHATAAWTPHVRNEDITWSEDGFTHGYLYIENVEITGNTAEWSGGAIAGCITSQNLVGEGSTAIHDNATNNTGPTWSKYSGEGTVEVFYSYKSWWEDFYRNRYPHAPCYLSKYMIGGGEYGWRSVSSEALLDADTLYKNLTLIAAATDATAGDPDVERARAGATVLIANNYGASCGGGIGTNGVVEIGKISPKVDVSVQKEWADTQDQAAQRPVSLKYQLFRSAGSEAEKELVDEVVVEAGEDGSYAYTWKSLIKYVVGSDEEIEYVYTVEEDPNFETTTAAGDAIVVGDHYKATAQRGEDMARDVEVPTTGESYDVVSQAIQNWTITNNYVETHEVFVSKADLGGSEVEGAVITVTGPDGFSATWTSTAEPHALKLAPGSYTMVETVAPEGYQRVTTAIRFAVGEDGAVSLGTTEVDAGGAVEVVDGNRVVLKDAPVPAEEIEPTPTPAPSVETSSYEVTVSKQEVGGGPELAGATLMVKDASGKVVEQWVSGAEAHRIALSPGDYTLTEVTAPEGYELAETMAFRVNADGTLECLQGSVWVAAGGAVVMYDAPTPEGGDEVAPAPHVDAPSITPVPKATPAAPATPATRTPAVKGGVKTGDEAPVAPIAAVALLAAGALGLAMYRRRGQE